MSWWFELTFGLFLILYPLSQMKNLGQPSYKSGPNWGKTTPWAFPTLIIYLILIFIGVALFIFGWADLSILSN